VATDEPGLLAELADFSPWDARRLSVEIPGAGFLVDHHILRHADHVAISNSTFSFTASMLNRRAVGFVRPDPNHRSLVRFDPWASPVLLDPVLEPKAVSAVETKLLSRLFSASDHVLHLGKHCAAWTNLARAINKDLRIREAGAGTSVDAWRRGNDIRHLQHLIVEDAAELPEILRGARETLRRARVDRVHYRLVQPLPMAEIVLELARYGYELFRAAEDGELKPVSAEDSCKPGRYVAVQERLLQPSPGLKRDALDIAALCRRHGIEVKGVIHVGAHEGQEISAYDAMRAERVLFIEANPVVYARLVTAMRGRLNVTCINRAISDSSGKVQLHLASFDQSSSLLPLARHIEVYPQIAAAGTVEVEAATLDAVVKEQGLGEGECNLLNIDVQGAEALVLRGAGSTLPYIEAINIEVNFSELYRGGAQIEDIDDLLETAGFRRVAMLSAYHPSWGDAFYIRSP
jgi:FkbM family methyltransferase